MSKISKNYGFTLIELSIVMVIIGLIVAGVVGGQALVQQAKIRKQIAEFNKYRIAYNAFQLEYDAIPGDFNRASQYWTGAANGGGNDELNINPDASTNPNTESLLFFNHLSRANLINQFFNNTSVLGDGYPRIKISPNQGMTAGSVIVGNNSYQTSVSRNFKAGLNLEIGQPNESGGNKNDDTGTSSPRIYSQIDTKMDDGAAMTGIFRAYRVWQSQYGNCLTGIDGDYLITNERPGCLAFYIIEE